MTEQEEKELSQKILVLLQNISNTVNLIADRFKPEVGAGIPVADAATKLNLHPRTIIIKLKTKEIPGYRIGRRWFVQMDDLREQVAVRSTSHANT